jgi:hypothetical protein
MRLISVTVGWSLRTVRWFFEPRIFLMIQLNMRAGEREKGAEHGAGIAACKDRSVSPRTQAVPGGRFGFVMKASAR